MVKGQPGQKTLARPHLKGKKLGMVVHTCHPSDGGKIKTGGSQSRPVWAKRDYLQNNQSKKRPHLQNNRSEKG
jgi:hypothetical protein